MIGNATKRSILRWIHLVLAIPILGYIYSPFKELPNYAPAVRYVAIPALVLYGPLDVERPCRLETYFETIGLIDSHSTRIPIPRGHAV